MEARLRRAIVLWVAMVCNSPCLRCSFILNYWTHYTTEQVKSQRSKCKMGVAGVGAEVEKWRRGEVEEDRAACVLSDAGGF